MKILLVATEPQVFKALKKMLNGIDSGIEIVEPTTVPNGTFDQVIKEKAPDLVLINKYLDVKNDHYPRIGVDLKTTVTFSTEMNDYAFGAFHIRRKQNMEKLAAPAHGAQHTLSHSSVVPPSNTIPNEAGQKNLVKTFKNRFLVKQGQKYISIDIDQVSFFYSEDRFIFLKTKDNHKFLVEYRIEELEQMLDPDIFFRVNRSFLISIHAIDQIHAYFGNRLKLFLIPVPEKDVIVSRERTHDFRIWLGE